MAICTGLGNGLEGNWKKLLEGQTAIAPIGHFNTDRLDYHEASCLAELWEQENVNHTCFLAKMTLDAIKPVPAETVIVWTGIKGNAEFIKSGQTMPPPYLPRHYRSWVAKELDIPDRGLEINAACASSTVGLALGAQKIAQGSCTNVLVCAADLVTRFVHNGFSALKALTAQTCRPFDRDRDGLSLGDGAVAILLTDEATAWQNQLEPLAVIYGWGIANDANHITGPARDGSGLVLAIENALTMASMKAGEVEAFCAHGTGTVYNDGMELTAVERVFGERRFPIFSIKGSIGHTLGAAGGIETAISVLAMREKQVPPNTGLQQAEERAIGRVSDQVQTFAGNNILTSNSGFGGVNAAILLEKV